MPESVNNSNHWAGSLKGLICVCILGVHRMIHSRIQIYEPACTFKYTLMFFHEFKKTKSLSMLLV